MNIMTMEFVWENKTFMDCRSHYSNPTAVQLFSISAFFVNFVIPLIIQTYCYASIGKRITEKNVHKTGELLRRSSSVDEERDRVCHTVIYDKVG